MNTGGYVVLERLSTVLRHFTDAAAAPQAAGRPSTGAGALVPGGRRDNPDAPFMRGDPDLVDLVRRAVEEVLGEKRPVLERRPAAPEPSTQADVDAAIGELFLTGALSAVDATRRDTAARELAAALRWQEEQERMEQAWRVEEARAAWDAGEEDALLALIL